MRWNRTFFLLIVGAMLIAVAPIASAGKPDCEADPSHPSCKPDRPDDEPAAGTTCVSPWWAGDVRTDDFTITLGPDQTDACVDVLTEHAGPWLITVTGSGARSLLIVPRDAYAPGDSCGGVRLPRDQIYSTFPLPHWEDPRFDEIPVATVNACPGDDPEGIGEFAETVERDLNGDGTVDETEIVMESTGEPHPLALLVFSSGSKRPAYQLIIEVDLPPLSQPVPPPP